MRAPFDIIIESPIYSSGQQIKTLGEILFKPLAGRDEDCNIILSHFENEYIEISLIRLRFIVRNLMQHFKKFEILKGQTVAVICFQGCNEMITALYFIALASIGCRVFLPMYFEKAEFSEWIDQTQLAHIILPGDEIMSLDSHEREKSACQALQKAAFSRGLKIWDSLSDFNLLELLECSEQVLIKNEIVGIEDQYIVMPDDEVLIVTTSGTSGHSRLVVYTHKSYFLNCLSWEQAGFFNPDVLGGKGFTPLFTHTMGIRAFINALWTGVPVCLITTEWFIEKPEIVRYFLLKMKPDHITGGPAVYNALIEMFRKYPELKWEIGAHFKTLVSSGARYNPAISNEIMAATRLRLHNAFGTTETQQVTSTLLSSGSVFEEGRTPLGKPLPGVSIGLIKTDTGADHYRLFVKSVFGCKYCMQEKVAGWDNYHETGDIVIFDNNKELYFSGRANQDYFKDSFGVKIPIPFIRRYYADLYQEIIHAEFYPIINFPGISALLFISETTLPQGAVNDSTTLKRYAGIIEGINNKLMNRLESFEFQHRHVCRIAILNQSLPLTNKGSISGKEIGVTWHELIARLTDSRKDASGIEITDRLYRITDKYTRFVSPQIGSMMFALKINANYHRGQKDSLFTYRHGKEIEVLDLVGGFGTNFTGHNHPRICTAITEFVATGKPAICNQVSIQEKTGLLAEKLNLMIESATGRSFQVIFANSGTEAVEISLHHACFEWKKRLEKLRDLQVQLYSNEKELNVSVVWENNMEIIENAVIRVIGLSRAFHGHSTGARSLLGNEKKRNLFRQLSHIEPLFIDDTNENWRDKLNILIKESVITISRIKRDNGVIEQVPLQVGTIIAAIAEPVTGEGGVHIVNRDLLKQLASQEFPLISDEIQCGLGRSGRIPEFESAQYFLFGKALGGGMEKISAVMIDSTRYQYNFSEYYVSTFGNGELAANVALATLELIDEEKLERRALKAGVYLQKKLSAIQIRYPYIIDNIRGKGLIQAIQFNSACARNSILLRLLFQTEKAGYLFSSWFFNRHQIRILPTLSAPHTLRIEPSAFFNKSETDMFCDALDELCRIITEGRTYDLFSFLMEDDPFIERQESPSLLDHYSPNLEPATEKAVKVAFIAHFVFPLQELRMLERDLERASDTGLRIFFNKMQVLMELKPIQIMATHLFHKKVHFSFYALPVDSAELEYLHKTGKRRFVVSKIQEAVDIAAANGAKVISLGGYTSILTNNGLSLAEPPGSRIITGNTLTAASGLIHLGKIIRQKPEFNKPNTIAIVGSTGNIGRIITQMIYEQVDICSDMVLISRSEKREMEMINELISKKNSGVRFRISANLSDMKIADVIVICTNTNDPIVFPHHIASDKPVLISDLSVPSALAEAVNLLTNVTILPFSAYVSLPEDKEVVISSYSPPGTVFCCAGEAILLALERCNEPLKGRIMPAAVNAITRLAAKHGFFDYVESLKSYKTAKS